MEGTGPRLSRVFSRYGVGPGPSAPVFNGPVRKWKRKWVRSQPNNDSTAGGKGNYLRQQHQHHQKTPSVLLCRWTPLTSSNSDDSSEPSKRKFRYTPVVVLDEKRKEAGKKHDDEANASKMNQSKTVNMGSDVPLEKPHFDDDFMEEIEEPNDEQAYFEDLDLQLT